MDGGNIGRLKTRGKMGGGYDVVGELEDDGEGRVAKDLDEPLFPAIRSWSRTSIAFAKEEPQMVVIQGLRPAKGCRGNTVSNLTN